MVSLIKFSREVKQEAKKVSWPSRKETVTTTIVVFIMIGVMAMFLLLADLVISSAVEFILGL